MLLTENKDIIIILIIIIIIIIIIVIIIIVIIIIIITTIVIINPMFLQLSLNIFLTTWFKLIEQKQSSSGVL